MKFDRKLIFIVWGIVSGLCMIIGGILVLYLFHPLVNQIIESTVPLVPGSDVTQAWMYPPIRPLLKIYYFNVTNPDVSTLTLLEFVC